MNTVAPGVLTSESEIFHSIHGYVESLGSLQTLRAVVPGRGEAVGTQERLSALSAVEEYLLALSNRNYLREVETSHLNHHYSYIT